MAETNAPDLRVVHVPTERPRVPTVQFTRSLLKNPRAPSLDTDSNSKMATWVFWDGFRDR